MFINQEIFTKIWMTRRAMCFKGLCTYLHILFMGNGTKMVRINACTVTAGMVKLLSARYWIP